MNRKVLCCGYAKWSSKNWPLPIPSPDRHSILRTIRLAANFAEIYRRLRWGWWEWVIIPILQQYRSLSRACTLTFRELLAPWDYSSFEGNFCLFLYKDSDTEQKSCESFEILFDNIKVSLHSLLFLCLVFDTVDMMIDRFHDLIVFAWLLVELYTKIQKDKLENILFILSAAIFQFVL